MTPECVDPRIARSRATVVQATTELLRTGGYSAVTIDAVSKASGVARTTIYRHYASVAELVMAVLKDLRPPTECPGSADPAEDLRQMLRQVADSVSTGLLPAMIEAVRRDPEFARLKDDWVLARRAETRQILVRLVELGALAPHVDLEVVNDLLVGPLFYRALMTGTPIDDAYIASLVTNVLTLATSDSQR